ncbi:carboxypeptidase-like regulatory domain-containing protein [Streptomyces sp. t39]|uniref:carboxypeptidase-like regulatory domain-containing protein n=1 Tax=Streptomyces sp. t39 TaxID=1828156 RepID=UPI0011CDBBB2|nr:carboxypeptidase-like regulatory domain-containing protein [Streptomyces sp. t39]TXS48946.1 carboxypeptidase regulatory-like domain-containing protein [Streptomyces sp. t39]
MLSTMAAAGFALGALLTPGPRPRPSRSRRPATTVHAHAARPDGRPVPRAVFTLLGPHGRPLARAVADDEGACVLRAPGRAAYLLVATADALRPAAAELAPEADGSALSRTLTLAPATATGHLTAPPAGTVRDGGDMAPLRGALAVLLEDDGTPVRTAATDGRGRFALRAPRPRPGSTGLVRGPRVLVLHHPGHRPAAFLVRRSPPAPAASPRPPAPAATVVLARYTDLGTLRGVVTDKQGVPQGSVRVTVTDGSGIALAAVTGPDGTCRFTGLPTGRFRAAVAGDGGSAVQVAVFGDDQPDGFRLELS